MEKSCWQMHAAVADFPVCPAAYSLHGTEPLYSKEINLSRFEQDLDDFLSFHAHAFFFLTFSKALLLLWSWNI